MEINRKALAFLLTILVSSIIEAEAVEVAEANFLPCPPSILIDSPIDKTYNTNSVWLNITLKTWFDSGNASRVVECSLDGKENITIPLVSAAYEDTFSTVTGSLVLLDLSESSHSITVYATYTYGTYSTSNSLTTNFIIVLPEPTPCEEPRQIGHAVILGAAVTVGVLCTSWSLLLYLFKRK
jgi:hypothetical protein